MKSNLETAVGMTRVIIRDLIEEKGDTRLLPTLFDMDLKRGDKEVIKEHLEVIAEIYKKGLEELKEMK